MDKAVWESFDSAALGSGFRQRTLTPAAKLPGTPLLLGWRTPAEQFTFSCLPPEAVEGTPQLLRRAGEAWVGLLFAASSQERRPARRFSRAKDFRMAAAPDDLCTVNDLAAWLPNYNHNDDTNLQSLITNGSLQVLTYLNRPHILASAIGALTETYDGNDSDRLLPRSFPIIAVTAVSVDGVAITPSTLPTLSGFVWDSRRILLRGFTFFRGVQNVQVSYTAGYSAVPLDLKQAAIETFALAYRQRTHLGEKSSSMGGQVTLAFDMSDVPPRSLAVFTQYRRIAL
jgi:hypothetical protein